jgi:hypothetical protein
MPSSVASRLMGISQTCAYSFHRLSLISSGTGNSKGMVCAILAPLSSWTELRHPEHKAYSVAEMLELERSHLMPKPVDFDGYAQDVARVSSSCLVPAAVPSGAPCSDIHPIKMIDAQNSRQSTARESSSCRSRRRILSSWNLFSRMSGLSEKAINDKIDKGVWAEGREWHRAPDGRRYVDVKGYEAWVGSGNARSRSGKRASGSSSRLIWGARRRDPDGRRHPAAAGLQPQRQVRPPPGERHH